MKTYTAAQMRQHEQEAAARGTGFAQLMENAGRAAAADLMRRLPAPGRALFVCGKGNNGGDALVMARLMQAQGWRADIFFAAGEKLSELAEANRQRLSGLSGVEFVGAGELEGRLKNGYTVITDGIFGTGFAGTLPADIASLCRRLNRAEGFKTALDLPTGLDCDSGTADPDTFRADLTYTFAAYKPAHHSAEGGKLCGETVCLDIGID
ncbi:Nicotinamide nucleotide repair protein [Kingella potus]|uniref:NAD(P)H-hydrate epimerase n=1 Tax=Kingella potus TaxID=265175 RepID=A0A377QXZ9_9NEIS|nr:NAD(P)H-hydrate epimerase [Kingella potus]UOP01609.1 NAD(P)H-hydrate epimerase [Kingella potus]STR00093.1 Nicotinamide nucleotide repair protein [Kingella potus]